MIRARVAARRVPLPLVVFAACLALAPAAAAGEETGRAFVRQAFAALERGEPEAALQLLDSARTEWPDSALVPNLIGDIQSQLGHWDDAVAGYTDGMVGEYPLHASWNRAAARHARAQAALTQAGVPADVAALPEGPQPDMLKALEEHALPDLADARNDFLSVLDLPEAAREPGRDGEARESVAALNRRLDALREIAEELKRRQQEQQQDQSDESQQDKQKQDQQGDKGEDQQDQQSEQDQQPDEQQPQPSDQDKEQDPSDEQPEPSDQPQPAEGSLSKEQVQQILDKLAELEQEGRQLQKLREAAARRAVEKDW